LARLAIELAMWSATSFKSLADQSDPVTVSLSPMPCWIVAAQPEIMKLMMIISKIPIGLVFMSYSPAIII
jgi:hypothetical protein